MHTPPVSASPPRAQTPESWDTEPAEEGARAASPVTTPSEAAVLVGGVVDEMGKLSLGERRAASVSVIPPLILYEEAVMCANNPFPPDPIQSPLAYALWAYPTLQSLVNKGTITFTGSYLPHEFGSVTILYPIWWCTNGKRFAMRGLHHASGLGFPPQSGPPDDGTGLYWNHFDALGYVPNEDEEDQCSPKDDDVLRCLIQWGVEDGSLREEKVKLQEILSELQATQQSGRKGDKRRKKRIVQLENKVGELKREVKQQQQSAEQAKQKHAAAIKQRASLKSATTKPPT